MQEHFHGRYAMQRRNRSRVQIVGHTASGWIVVHVDLKFADKDHPEIRWEVEGSSLKLEPVTEVTL